MSTVKKAQARIAPAWAARNWPQVGPFRRGDGGQSMTTKDAAHGARRDPVAELGQLAMDAAITPARILACQTF